MESIIHKKRPFHSTTQTFMYLLKKSRKDEEVKYDAKYFPPLKRNPSVYNTMTYSK